ncbi:hypothetical protein SD70_07775 [Gordoniibacillus kamchatkensis]|uniref:DNA-binding response regulator n=1 Tax=Gordoniibacillus kamchatkensis TaxID=1590651 RepID=A0ABR5ALW3_9BACL|nr:response regulator [Paenibacillus sp. VKM B-2647]KIL41337.1 hypothetical protein SD70_07775 [Paenibacillus sp. VKM B-2647]
MRILIVDDEAIVRIALKTIVNWEAHGFELIGTASDAESAMQTVEKEAPDLVITDLKMPGRSGLDLLAWMRERSYDGMAVVLSNYGEFELVREAMKLGAFDYLLKVTLQPEDLLDKLGKARDKLLAEREARQQQLRIRSEWSVSRQLQLQRFYAELLAGELEPARAGREAERCGLSAELGAGYVMFLRIERFEEVIATGKIKDQKLLSFSVCNIAEEALREQAAARAAVWTPREYVILASPPEDGINKDKQMHLAAHLAGLLTMYLNLEVSVGVGGAFGGWGDVPAALRRTAKALDMRFYDERQIVHIEDAVFSQETMMDRLPELIPLIGQAVERGLLSEVGDPLRAVLAEAAARRVDPEALNRFGTLLWGELTNRLLERIPAGHEPTLRELEAGLLGAVKLERLQEAWAQALQAAGRMLAEASERRYRKEVLAVMELVEQRLAGKISLADIAAVVNLNETYLSRLFKQETGRTIVEHIHRRKMDRAVELLRDPDMTVGAVADAVGVDDPFYFNRLFRKYIGVSPSDFRKKALGKR